jgi:hypothetical protein
MEILGQNELWTLAIVKDYLVRRLEAENTEIAEVCYIATYIATRPLPLGIHIPSHPAPPRPAAVQDERLIDQYAAEINKMRQEIENLQSRAKLIQNTRCAACGRQLELPTVHFMCDHSYHAKYVYMAVFHVQEHEPPCKAVPRVCSAAPLC